LFNSFVDEFVLKFGLKEVIVLIKIQRTFWLLGEVVFGFKGVLSIGPSFGCSGA
jgi:hypothetical protein